MNNYSISQKTIDIFSMTSFRKFLIDRGIINMAISFAIGSQINHFTDNIIKEVILPLLSPDMNNDNINDIDKIIKYEVKVGPFKFKIGKIIYNIIKFILIIYLVFIISSVTISVID